MRLGWLGLCLFLAGLLGAWMLSRNLAVIARWAVHRSLPGVVMEIKSLEITSLDRLEAESLVLKSRKSGDILLKLDKGVVLFKFDDLFRRQIREIRLINPTLTITPKLFTAISDGTSKTTPSGSRSFLAIRRLACDYGEIKFSDFDKNIPAITTKFSCDFQSLGGEEEPGTFQKLVLWDLHAKSPGFEAAPFLNLDLVTIAASFEAMARKQTIHALAINGGSLVIGDALQSLFSGEPDASTSKSTEAWSISAIDIKNVAVRVDDSRQEISDITFALNTTLRDIPLNKAASGFGGTEQLIEFTDLEILSPYDTFARVLTLRSIFLRFTLGELLRHQIRELTILHPMVYISEDLFWYMDDAKARLPQTSSDPKQPGWVINKLKVAYGKLVLGSGGRVNYGIPLNFYTDAENVSLDNLKALHMDAALTIPGERYPFPDYQLEFTTEGGELRFAYPPEKEENNLVGTISIQNILWRQYLATDAWLTTTFDRQGINGQYGAKFYDGYVSGGFSFFFRNDSPWIGWIAGKSVSLKELTDIAAPKNFQMTGPLDFRLQMDAFGKKIARVSGELSAKKSGKMKIGKLDDLLAKIPSTWSGLKKSSTKIALETIRDFDYTKADGNFWFVEGQGIFELKLQGPLGSRNFETVLHADESPEGRWKHQPNP